MKASSLLRLMIKINMTFKICKKHTTKVENKINVKFKKNITGTASIKQLIHIPIICIYCTCKVRQLVNVLTGIMG